MTARVGLMGVQCDTANMGLAALAYSVIGIVHDLVPGEAEIVLFSINSDVELARMAESLGISNKRFTAVPFYRKKPAAMVNSARQMRQCDVILDFTGGDSFSDIYGIKRLVRKLGDKQMALASRVPFVLAPQTIGPFERRVTLPWVKHVLNRAALVYTRDQLSRDFLAGLTRREVLVATDVAVTLPWAPNLFDLPETDRPRVGFNVSGLLWNGGYTGRNQFNLLTEYRDYCRGVIDGLRAECAEVHLVPHVLSRGDAEDEDDVAVSRVLADQHPECILAPTFRSPMEAKSYISQLDVLIGSRMHATIAAFTSGVPTVPVAYSRKFAGFFENLGYPVLVDLSELETQTAVEATLGHVRGRAALVPAVTEGDRRAQDRIRSFTTRLAALLER
jgi:colanic acid/amylovoran biosynthesis protein